MHFFRILPFILFGTCIAAAANTPRILIVTGELSSDRLAAWYLDKFCHENNCVNAPVWAVGGPHLAKKNVSIIRPCSDFTLGYTNIFTGLRHAWHLWSARNELETFAKENNITHAILTDCPLMNLALARRLKNLDIHVTYIAPPELWLWGTWGVQRWLRWYCDNVVVLYPFEKQWYAEHNLKTSWYGWPLYNRFAQYTKPPPKKERVAFLPGSRRSEVNAMLPLFCRVATTLAQQYPQLEFVWPVPSHLMNKEIGSAIAATAESHRITILTEPHTMRKQMANCCCALTKPGTSTLELGFLHIPMVITFQTSWLTYQIASWLCKLPWVGLPNIMLNQDCFPELLQHDCTYEKIVPQMQQLLDGWRTNSDEYKKHLTGCINLHQMFAHPHLS